MKDKHSHMVISGTRTNGLNYFPWAFKSYIIAYYCFTDAWPHLTCHPAKQHHRFLISITWFHHMMHHIFQRLKSSFTSLKINTGTQKQFLAYQKILPAKFMDIVINQYHLTLPHSWSINRYINWPSLAPHIRSAHALEPDCTFETYEENWI